MPVLSETLIRARRTGASWSVMGGLLVRGLKQVVLLELLAQGAAIEAEHLGGAALVARGVGHHRFQQGGFHLFQHHLVEVGGGLAVGLGALVAHGGFPVVPARLVADLRRRLRVNVVLAVAGATVGGIHAALSSRCSVLAKGVSNKRSRAASWPSPPSR